MLRDITNDDDWGLDALAPEARRRPSLLSQMAREQREAEGSEAGPAPGGDVVTWGGSGGATGIDLEEQEELLSRYFRPHDVKRYMAYQREVDDNYAAMKARAGRGAQGGGSGPGVWACARRWGARLHRSPSSLLRPPHPPAPGPPSAPRRHARRAWARPSGSSTGSLRSSPARPRAAAWCRRAARRRGR